MCIRDSHEIFPHLRGVPERVFQPLDAGVAGDADLVFMATPHGVAVSIVPEFLEAAKDKLRRFNGIPAEEDEVLPTVGGMNGIWLAYKVLLRPGDRVIVVTPNYPPLINRPRDFQADVIEARAGENWHLDVEGIEKLVSDKVKVITICNPNNPTGAVYTRDELEELAELAIRHGLYVVSDELYENLTYDGRRHVSIASLDGMFERTITIFAFTKTYGMSGLRIGYVAAERELVKRMRAVNAGVVIHPGTIEQIGAAAALRKCSYYVESLRSYLEKVRDRLVEKLSRVPGVGIWPPEGALFAFPDLSAFFESDVAACEYLRKEARVLVYGGSGFGAGGVGHVRMNFCTTMEIIEEAGSRIAGSLLKLGAGARQGKAV